eukprot:9490309-Pyramimonas_sp.AAC.3
MSGRISMSEAVFKVSHWQFRAAFANSISDFKFSASVVCPSAVNFLMRSLACRGGGIGTAAQRARGPEERRAAGGVVDKRDWSCNGNSCVGQDLLDRHADAFVDALGGRAGAHGGGPRRDHASRRARSPPRCIRRRS